MCNESAADTASINFSHARATVHTPSLAPRHCHNFMFEAKYPENFPHLSDKDGIKKLVRLMLAGSVAIGQPRGRKDRDRMIQRVFLEKNSASRILQFDHRTPENLVPGGSFLIESLITEAQNSRYSVPSRQYLESFRRYRSVDMHSLNQVKHSEFTFISLLLSTCKVGLKRII